MKRGKSLQIVWGSSLLKLLRRRLIMWRRHSLLLEMKLKIGFKRQTTVKKKIRDQVRNCSKDKIYKIMVASVDLLFKIVIIIV